jgi:putative resolvase
VHVVYARVSSRKQKQDLVRQINDLQRAFFASDAKGSVVVLSDVASGLNENRRNFIKMIEMLHAEEIDTIWVTTPDRLCRYGVGILQTLARLTGTNIRAIHTLEQRSNAEQVAQDMLAVVNVFIARHNGKRAQLKRRLRTSEGC